jgi:hypothetical protein
LLFYGNQNSSDIVHDRQRAENLSRRKAGLDFRVPRRSEAEAGQICARARHRRWFLILYWYRILETHAG